MDSILVTGARGFIGTNMVSALFKAKYRVTCFDLPQSNIDAYQPRSEDSYEGIIHLAGVSRVSDAEKDPIKCLESNIVLTAKVLALKAKWAIIASSCEPPTNVYGFSKRAAEDYAKIAKRNTVIIRLANVYGPGMQSDKLLPRLARGEIDTVDESVFPFEHVHVSHFTGYVLDLIKSFETGFTPFTMKLATGIARNKEELLSVASSY